MALAAFTLEKVGIPSPQFALAYLVIIYITLTVCKVPHAAEYAK
jgi:hypothetical protein